jgi:uncharacterized integral membrane protein
MPWKTLLFLFALSVVVVFAALNMHHTTNISFGFHEFTAVPIFVSLFVAFLAGNLFMVPLLFRKKLKKIPKSPKLKKEESRDEVKPKIL